MVSVHDPSKNTHISIHPEEYFCVCDHDRPNLMGVSVTILLHTRIIVFNKN